jgi:hypothetical protein
MHTAILEGRVHLSPNQIKTLIYRRSTTPNILFYQTLPSGLKRGNNGLLQHLCYITSYPSENMYTQISPQAELGCVPAASVKAVRLLLL